MLKRNYVLLVLQFCFQITLAQHIDVFFENQETVPFQKIYVVTDRDFYFYQDTLWFSAFVVDGVMHTPITSSCNLYVNIINEAGKIVKDEIFPLDSGRCGGWLTLSGKVLTEGNYLFRAYTDYARNFGHDAFFTKTISISKLKNTTIIQTEKQDFQDYAECDIKFFPEGGFLLADKINKVAFKAENNKNQPIEINGRLINSNKEVITTVQTQYNGMGKFWFIPEKNVEYFVEIEGHPGKIVKLPPVQDTGSKLMVDQIKNKTIAANIITTSSENETFYIAALHRGKQLFHIEISDYKKLKALRINTNHFKEGINRIVLLNQFFQPLSERLIFINKSENINIKLKLNKEEFHTREKVEVSFEGDELQAPTLSLVVINENALPAKGISQNIKSYLLLESELKGNISNPADFFTDNIISSREKLDLLMLTHGWSNYFWNTIEKQIQNLYFSPGYGIDIAGNIKHREKPLSNSEVKLLLSADEKNNLYSTVTDLNGYFNFKNIAFFDSAKFIVQCNDYKKGRHTEILLENKLIDPPLVSEERINRLKAFSEIPLLLYRLHYSNESNLQEFIPNPDSKMLDEINVTGKKPEHDGHYRMYSTPNYSLKITDEDFSYVNVFQYLAARIPGVRVKGKNLTIRQAPALMKSGNETFSFSRGDNDDMFYNSDAPLYLLDRMIVDNNIIGSISVKDIDKVEILTGAIAGIFGGLGEKGVISVLTKNDFSHYFDNEKVPGLISQSIKGFKKYREFYSPVYSSENIHSKIPDYRITLYWEPVIKMKDARAHLSFFTCDNISRYVIIAEGVTENGQPCVGTAKFEVNKQSDISVF
jgi:hypothetical protein